MTLQGILQLAVVAAGDSFFTYCRCYTGSNISAFIPAGGRGVGSVDVEGGYNLSML